jgi:hypothetical protein
MFSDSFFINFIKKIYRLDNEKYVFWITLVFYLLLWLVNPGNKIIALAFVLLIFIYYHRVRDIKVSLLFAYLASSIIFTGKRYLIELIPPGVFSEEVFPQGHVLFLVISPQQILLLLMGLFLIRDNVKFGMKKIYYNKWDIFLLLFFIWVIFSDLVASIHPEVSLLFSVFSINLLILYFYLKSYTSKNNFNFLPILLSLFASLVIFESIISFQQLIASSPINKNIEAQIDIEYFGHTPDEPQFRFRPVGTFQHANMLGMWLSFWVSVLFSYLFKKQNNLLFTSFIFGIISLVFTLSRSSWLGVGISFMFMLWLFEKVKKIKAPAIFTKHVFLLLILSLVLFIFFVFPRAEKSIYTFIEGGGYLRQLQIQDTLTLIIKNPVFGVGTNMNVLAGYFESPSSVFSSVALAVHNKYLLITVEQGIPALVFFLSFLTYLFRKNIVIAFQQKLLNVLSYVRIGFLGGILALIIVGLFQPFMGENLILLSFGILGGLQYEKANK